MRFDSKNDHSDGIARIHVSALDNLTKEQQEQFQRFPANLTRVLLCTGGSTSAYLSLGASFARSSLPPKDRELAILRVGVLSGSAYERMQHLPIARRVGWSDAEIAAIESGDQLPLGSRAAAILRFVDECVYRIRVSDPVFEALRHFASDQEIAELTLLIGHYMMTARFLETLGVALDNAATDWGHLLP